LPSASITEKCVVLSPSRRGPVIEPRLAAGVARSGSMPSRSRRVVFGGQIGGRRDTRRVAEKFRPVEIATLHRLDQKMRARRVVHLAELVTLEDVEHLEQHDAPGRRRRHRENVVTAIAAADRRVFDRLVAGKIGARHDAARRLHGAGDVGGDGAVIERGGSVAGDVVERVGKIALDQRIAWRQHAAVGFEKDLRRGRPLREPPLVQLQRIGDILFDRDAVARQRNRRRDQLRQREFARAVFRMRQRQSRDRPGHAHRQRRFARFLRIGIALRVEEHVAGGGGGRGLAIVDRDLGVRAGQLDHHVAATAEIAGFRIGHRHREADRHRGVDRIAPPLHHLDADAGGARLLPHHHAVAGGDRCERRLLRKARILRERRQRCDAEGESQQAAARDPDRGVVLHCCRVSSAARSGKSAMERHVLLLSLV
jgi:hypothetical protein